MRMAKNTTLREWLDRSQYQGSIKRLSVAIGVPKKTVEDWFYRGAKPSLPNRLKLYMITGLEQYAPRSNVEATRLQQLQQEELTALHERTEKFLLLLASLHKELDYFKEAAPSEREVLRQRLDAQQIAYVSNLLQLLLNEERFRDWLTISTLPL